MDRLANNNSRDNIIKIGNTRNIMGNMSLLAREIIQTKTLLHG